MEPTAIGDRAGLGITTVLTEIFLLEFSGQGMPKVNYIMAAELYVIVSFAFIFLALVESAIVHKASLRPVLKQKKEWDEENHGHVDEVMVVQQNTVNSESFITEK